MTGICAGMIYNLVRKLSEDKEDILASREKSLASIESVPGVPSPAKSRASRVTENTDCNGCYVPPPPSKGLCSELALKFLLLALITK